MIISLVLILRDDSALLQQILFNFSTFDDPITAEVDVNVLSKSGIDVQNQCFF